MKLILHPHIIFKKRQKAFLLFGFSLLTNYIPINTFDNKYKLFVGIYPPQFTDGISKFKGLELKNG